MVVVVLGCWVLRFAIAVSFCQFAALPIDIIRKSSYLLLKSLLSNAKSVIFELRTCWAPAFCLSTLPKKQGVWNDGGPRARCSLNEDLCRWICGWKLMWRGWCSGAAG